MTAALQPSFLTSDQEASPTAGNRFDSTEFGVVYFGTTQECCFGETLARFRPSLQLAEMVKDDWKQFMHPGQLPADWRDRRAMVRAVAAPQEVFLDVEAIKTREYLQKHLALGLSALGASDLDVSVIRGHDRRVTRLISAWAYHAVDEDGIARYAGVRYLSRLNTDWECWAAFDDLLYVGDAVNSEPIAA
ncbi:MAG TPA: RES family NAD+ phosphorylase, partial [Jatrophihabitantaceae bacterium]|nr:RES family NAD+ phosphorylase [Jatrophihabitantaceae bacterium]